MFLITDSALGEEFWITDGTALGTHILTDIGSGALDAQIESVARVDDQVLFDAFYPNFGIELFSMPIASF